MPGLIISPRARIFHGHEWVYGSEIKKSFGDPKPGDVVTLKDFRDRPLGSAIYNPRSQIVARRFSRRAQDLDRDFFTRRIERALVHRKSLNLEPADFARIVWSESDGLPGVILDRYGDCFVLQTNTLAMDQRRSTILESILEVFDSATVIERNDGPIRKPEGLEVRVGVLHGEAPGRFPVRIGEITLHADLLGGQKTGLYLDQWANYAPVAALSPGRKVLDCFANQGGFALSCKAAGAAAVTAVESSADAVAAGRENALASGLRIDFVEDNVFDYLKAAEKAGDKFDMVILDPPTFARSKRHLRDAIRGYKEIHLRALRILEPGGVLVTFCCSNHVSRQDFLDVISDASVDAKRKLRLRDRYEQRPDHPVVVSLPETEYLRGFAFEAMASF